MVSVAALWMPILLSAVFVFVASSVLHMVLPYHWSDFHKLPAEDEVRDALRKFKIPPGNYTMPCPDSPKEMGTPEFLEKCAQGPVGMVTMMKNGPPAMGTNLAMWFAYCVGVGVFTGFVAGGVLETGTDYPSVFHVVGLVSFACYAGALVQNSIWYSLAWSVSVKNLVDGLVYALLTAGTFGWLWP